MPGGEELVGLVRTQVRERQHRDGEDLGLPSAVAMTKNTAAAIANTARIAGTPSGGCGKAHGGRARFPRCSAASSSRTAPARVWARGGLLLEAARDDRGERGRQLRREVVHARGVLAQDRRGDVDLARTGERTPPGGELVEHDASAKRSLRGSTSFPRSCSGDM